MSTIKKVLILAGDTDGNIGDSAIVFSMCEELRRINPDIKITLVSGDLLRDREFFGATTIRRGILGLPALVKAAMMSDLILCGGGGLFQDDSSLVKMPYWAFRIAFIRLFYKKVIGYSLGVGPLRCASSRLFARLAFACMDQISVRDPEAKKTSERLTPKPIYILPDPALILPPSSEEEAYRILEQNTVPIDGSPLVGVAIRRWFHHSPTLIPHKYAVKYHLKKIPGKEKYKRMTSLLAEVFDRMADEYRAYIVFMPTYNVAHEADYRICEEVIGKMKSCRTSLIQITDPRLYKAITGRLSVMLGGRMHPAVFSVGMGTPIVGLAYNQKFFGFFKLLGLQDKIITVEDFVHKEMTNELVNLLSEGISHKSNILPRVFELAKLIREITENIME
ncbi:MAG: polysaccharide pyruvyl transferase family protein [Candidatus Hodarchaeota archaeon]